MNMDQSIENAELDEEQLEEVVRTLFNSTTDDQKMVAALLSNNGSDTVSDEDSDNASITHEEVQLAINPITGELTASPKGESESEIDKMLAERLSITLEELNSVPTSVNDIDIPDEMLISAASQKGISEKSMLELIPMLKEYRAKAEEDIDWYGRLPLELQGIISKQCAGLGNRSRGAKKMMAECLIQELLQDAGVAQINIDFQKSMEKALDLGPIIKMSLDREKTSFETGLKNKAIEFREAGDTVKADQLDRVSEAFRQSYTFEDYIKATRTGKLKVKKFDIEKINRYVRDFNAKYEGDTPFIIHDIAKILPILYRKFTDDYDSNDITRFVISFIKFTSPMSSTDVVDHTFMSYVISNVIKLDLMSTDEEENSFMSNFVSNLHNAILAAKEGSGI